MSIFTKFSLRNAMVICLAVLLIIVGGVYYGTSAKMETMPNVSMPIIIVSAMYPGASPEDVSKSVSNPIINAVKGIQGVKSAKATSNESIAIIVTELDYSKDTKEAQAEIEDAINKITFPSLVTEPVVSRVSFGALSVVTYSITGDKTANEMDDFITNELKPQIIGTDGVSNITTDGLIGEKVYIKINSKKMYDNGLQLQDVMNAIKTGNFSMPLGSVDKEDLSLTVKITEKTASLNSLESTPLVVMPNTLKMSSDAIKSISEAMVGLYKAMGDMGKGVGELSKATMKLAQGNASNTQAIMILSNIQIIQTQIKNQQQILSSPNTTEEQKKNAQMEIAKNNAILEQSTQMLAKSLNLPPADNKKPNMNINSNTNGSGMPSMSSKSNSANTQATKASIKVISLSDIATIKIEKNTQTSITRANSKPAILLSVYKNEDANVVEVVGAVEKEVAKITDNNKDINIEKINDLSDGVRSSVSGLVKEGILGAIFAVIIIALFLRNYRATIIAVVSIPLSVLITLILMPMFNITLNTMSLSGMAIAVGRIVDDSIVVIENIYRRMRAKKEGEDNVVEDATREVSSAITSSTLTTVCVFLPLTFVSGMVGKMFVPFALTVVICIISSLLVAVTVVPLMSKFMLKKLKPKEKVHESKIENAYISALKFSLSHRALIIVLSIVLLVAASASVLNLGVQFLQPSKNNVISAKVTLPPGTALKNTNELVKKMEEYLNKRNDIKVVSSVIGDVGGTRSFFGGVQGTNQAEVTVVLKDNADTNEAIDQMLNESKLISSKDDTWSISAASMSGASENLQVTVTGKDIKEIKKTAKVITDNLKKLDSLSNISNNLSADKPELSIDVYDDKAAEYGLSPIVIASMLRSYFSYDNITTMLVKDKKYDVAIGFSGNKMKNIETIKNFKINTMNGEVKLKEIAKIAVVNGPASISEDSDGRYAIITAEIKGKDTFAVAGEVKTLLENIKNNFSKDTEYKVGGSMDDITEGFSQMGVAILVAIFLVFITMVVALGEASAALAILFSLPFAVIGAMLGLLFTNNPITMSGLIGMLMLIGIVVTNAIVLMDRVLSNRKKGMTLTNALIEAGRIRLRPIFMTAAATIMALMPLALGFSEGSAISAELGIVVIGGLTMSTLLTLIIVPIMYSLFEGLKNKMSVNKQEI